MGRDPPRRPGFFTVLNTQRRWLRELEAMGLTIDNIRKGRGSHVIVYVTAPNGRKDIVTVSADLTSNPRTTKNFIAQARRLLK